MNPVKPQAGSRWRLLVHDVDPERPAYTTMAHHVVPASVFEKPRQYTTEHVIPAVFDEFVAGTWLHVEEMGPHVNGRSNWWVRVGEHVFWVDVDRDGNATRVTHEEQQ